MYESIPQKQEELRQNGSFNHRAETVSATIFTKSQFFDAHDLTLQRTQAR